MSEVEQGRGTITLPILMMHGDADAMAACEGSRIFHAGVGSTDKSLKLYPGLYHEIFNEPERLAVLGDVAEWLEARI